MVKYLIFKQGVHVTTAFTPEEADRLYAELEADDIQEHEENDDMWMGLLSAE